MKTPWKKYNRYQIADLLRDESFIDWIQKDKPSASIWNKRIHENPELYNQTEQAEQILRKLQSIEFKEDYSRLKDLKQKIDSRLDLMGARDEFGKYDDELYFQKKDRFKYIALVASLALLVAMIFLFRFPAEVDSFSDTNFSEIRNTRNGNRLTVHLSDGSKVKLNSGSQIKYEKFFSDTARVIYLKGEAFFEVAKDSLRPFRVFAANTEVEALGTSFNVNVPTENKISVSLLTGRVAVKNVSKGIVRYLDPGEMIFSDGDEFGEVQSFDFMSIAWKDEILVFQDASREEVFERLERWYGVSFDLGQELNTSWHYTGQFNNQSLHNVLLSIGHAEDFNFKIQNKKVVIKPIEKQ